MRAAETRIGPAPAPAPLRTLSGVTLIRRGTVLLDAVGLDICRGERLVILGPNGAGKTLLMQIGHRLIRPTAGTVGDEGEGLREAMVFQRPTLLRRSVLANLLFAIEHARPRVPAGPSGGRRPAALAALDIVGLAALADRPARLLSGGEQQRVSIARAAALQPDLIWFDEPTANLDPAATAGIETALDRMHRTGTTCVISTHDVGQARRIADRVVLMAAGRILEVTAAADFFERPATDAGRRYLRGGLLNV